MYTEAKDNVKFLITLERHFKNIITGSLPSVQVNCYTKKEVLLEIPSRILIQL